jgi:hypothetical protein
MKAVRFALVALSASIGKAADSITVGIENATPGLLWNGIRK